MMIRTMHTAATSIDVHTTGHKDYLILSQAGLDDNGRATLDQISFRESDIPEMIRVLNSINLVKLD